MIFVDAIRLAIITLLIVSSLNAQLPSANQKRAPRLEDYPVSDGYNGSPAPLKLTKLDEMQIRERLTDYSKRVANFAGHYEFVMWGCGTNCTAGAIVDLKTGAVHSAPLSEKTKWLPGWERWGICARSWPESIDHPDMPPAIPWQFRAESRL